MKRLVKIAGFGLLLLSMALFVVSCTTGQDGDEAVFGGSRIIHEDESIDGNLAVFGGDITLAKKAEVNGDLTVFGGTVKIEEDAKVDGNLTVLGGDVTLKDNAEIDGDVVSLGGHINRSPKAIVDGEWHTFGGTEQNATITDIADSLGIDLDDENLSREELEAEIEAEIKADATPTVANPSITGTIFNFFGDVLSILLRTVVFAVLALVLTLFLPQHVRRIGHTAEKAPVASAAVGCLSIPALAVLALIAIMTIIGIPLGILIPFFATAGMVLGWIGLGFFFGTRLLKMAEIRAPRPAAAAAVGAGSLALVGYMAQIVPIFGDLLMPFLGMWGLGATILTRGGRQSYPTRSGFNRPIPPAPIFDPLDELDELDFGAPPKKASGGGGIDSLFADLAADLGIDDLLDDDDDDDQKPNRPEKPVKPPK